MVRTIRLTALSAISLFCPPPEPTYSKIYNGEWLDEVKPYHVVHRIASYPDAHGIFSDIMDFSFSRDVNIRIDTHKDNLIMQHNIEKHGFTYCGIIYLVNGDERLAYQKMRKEPVFHQKSFQERGLSGLSLFEQELLIS